MSATSSRSSRAFAVPAGLLGAGIGGLFDGVLLHQVLQWHHMLTSAGRSAHTVAGLEANTLADGVFHLGCLVLLGVGAAATWGAVRDRGVPRAWVLIAWILVGWGLFNLVEGLIDHQILGIHHVRAGPDQAWYDAGYLALGAVLVASGPLLSRRSAATSPSRPGVGRR